MTDDRIDAVFNALPGGAAGFCKDWGYRQFARAVLEAGMINLESQEERLGFLTARCRDAQEIGSRYAWCLHAIATLPVPDQDNMVAANMRRMAQDCLRGGLGMPLATADQTADAPEPSSPDFVGLIDTRQRQLRGRLAGQG